MCVCPVCVCVCVCGVCLCVCVVCVCLCVCVFDSVSFHLWGCLSASVFVCVFVSCRV